MQCVRAYFRSAEETRIHWRTCTQLLEALVRKRLSHMSYVLSFSYRHRRFTNVWKYHQQSDECSSICISLTAWSSSNLHKTLPYSGQAASKIQLPPEKAVAGKEFLQNEELKLLSQILNWQLYILATCCDILHAMMLTRFQFVCIISTDVDWKSYMLSTAKALCSTYSLLSSLRWWCSCNLHVRGGYVFLLPICLLGHWR